MINPHICYAVSFSIALSLYLPGWSDLYPPLSLELSLFLLLTIFVHTLAGIWLGSKRVHVFQRLDNRHAFGPMVVTMFLYTLWLAEFYYAGGVPFFKILMMSPYDYKLFGIPTLHVFVVTFSSFYTLYLFHIYLSKRSFLILVLYAVNLMAALLIYNRGMLLFNLSASVFLFVMREGRVSLKHGVLGITAIVFILYLFGVLGSLRVSNESQKSYSNEGFLETGHASQAFLDSAVPPEFFWTYMYTTSPLANLQKNVAVNEPPPFGLGTFFGWLNNEILFDFISKRINVYRGKKPLKEYTLPGPFNVSTIYSGSFSYFGWWGLILMGIVILLIPTLFLKILPPASPFFLTAFAILSTLFLFMIFDNTISFTGLSFSLVYPVLLHPLTRRFEWLKSIFL